MAANGNNGAMKIESKKKSNRTTSIISEKKDAVKLRAMKSVQDERGREREMESLNVYFDDDEDDEF